MMSQKTVSGNPTPIASSANRMFYDNTKKTFLPSNVEGDAAAPGTDPGPPASTGMNPTCFSAWTPSCQSYCRDAGWSKCRRELVTNVLETEAGQIF